MNSTNVCYSNKDVVQIEDVVHIQGSQVFWGLVIQISMLFKSFVIQIKRGYSNKGCYSNARGSSFLRACYSNNDVIQI